MDFASAAQQKREFAAFHAFKRRLEQERLDLI
jgi:hypothetical protein